MLKLPRAGIEPPTIRLRGLIASNVVTKQGGLKRQSFRHRHKQLHKVYPRTVKVKYMIIAPSLEVLTFFFLTLILFHGDGSPNGHTAGMKPARCRNSLLVMDQDDLKYTIKLTHFWTDLSTLLGHHGFYLGIIQMTPNLCSSPSKFQHNISNILSPWKPIMVSPSSYVFMGPG